MTQDRYRGPMSAEQRVRKAINGMGFTIDESAGSMGQKSLFYSCPELYGNVSQVQKPRAGTFRITDSSSKPYFVKFLADTRKPDIKSGFQREIQIGTLLASASERNKDIPFNQARVLYVSEAKTPQDPLFVITEYLGTPDQVLRIPFLPEAHATAGADKVPGVVNQLVAFEQIGAAITMNEDASELRITNGKESFLESFDALKRRNMHMLVDGNVTRFPLTQIIDFQLIQPHMMNALAQLELQDTQKGTVVHRDLAPNNIHENPLSQAVTIFDFEKTKIGTSFLLSATANPAEFMARVWYNEYYRDALMEEYIQNHTDQQPTALALGVNIVLQTMMKMTRPLHQYALDEQGTVFNPYIELLLRQRLASNRRHIQHGVDLLREQTS